MPEYKDLNEIVQAISSENRALREEITRRSMAVHSDRGDNARKALNFGRPEF